MTTFAAILPTILVVLVVAFTAGIAQQLVLNLFGVQNIANPGTQKFVRSTLKSFVFTAMFAVGFAIIGSPYTLLSFLMVWGFLTVLEYILPERPTR